MHTRAYYTYARKVWWPYNRNRDKTHDVRRTNIFLTRYYYYYGRLSSNSLPSAELRRFGYLIGFSFRDDTQSERYMQHVFFQKKIGFLKPPISAGQSNGTCFWFVLFRRINCGGARDLLLRLCILFQRTNGHRNGVFHDRCVSYVLYIAYVIWRSRFRSIIGRLLYSRSRLYPMQMDRTIAVDTATLVRSLHYQLLVSYWRSLCTPHRPITSPSTSSLVQFPPTLISHTRLLWPSTISSSSFLLSFKPRLISIYLYIHGGFRLMWSLWYR